ncbi:MAG: hypothetical protein MI864_02745 [Pseudomonadales bacterium]|nr:hypothetical protein [Pseudomonadales bacterium]
MPKFNEVKKQVLECLYEGCVLHESRSDIDIKNLLEVGVVSVEEVAEIIRRSRGNEYESSPHHMDNNIDVHVIKTRYQSAQWYIKWYFIEPDAVFISVHQ